MAYGAGHFAANVPNVALTWLFLGYVFLGVNSFRRTKYYFSPHMKLPPLMAPEVYKIVGSGYDRLN